MRRPVKKRPALAPDLVYQSVRVSKFINYLMERGKKNAARRIVYSALELLKERTKTEDALAIFEEALKNVGPITELRSRRVGGANYQIPYEVSPERKNTLSMRWIIEAARSKKGRPTHEKLADELLAATKNEGEAIKKRENVHRMAEANRAFAHFARTHKRPATPTAA